LDIIICTRPVIQEENYIKQLSRVWLMHTYIRLWFLFRSLWSKLSTKAIWPKPKERRYIVHIFNIISRTKERRADTALGTAATFSRVSKTNDWPERENWCTLYATFFTPSHA